MATSLDILRPSPSPPAAIKSVDPSGREVESRALKFANLLCSRNFTDPLMKQLLVSDFKCQVELPGGRVGMVHSRSEFINHYTKHNGTRLLDVSNVTTEIDEKSGLGRVMLLLRIADSPRGIPQEAVSVLWWRRDKGAWRCYQQTGMRGVSGFQM